MDNNKEEQIRKTQADENEEIKETGTLRLGKESGRHNIQLMTIIGEIEGQRQSPVIQKPLNMSI